MFFLFILFIVPFLYYSHECGVYPPKNASYCFNHFENPDNKICCMLTDRQTNNSFCKLVDDSLFDHTTYENYDMECRNDTDIHLIGYPCGNPDPQSVDDCSDFSESKNPCCFYQNKFTGRTSCFFLGQLTSTTLITYDKETINCSGTILSLNMQIILIYVIYIFSMIL